MREALLPTNEGSLGRFGYLRGSFLWIPVVFCISILIIVDIFEIQTYSYDPLRPSLPAATGLSYSHQKMLLPTKPTRFTIDQEGCRIPYLEPFDTHVKAFIFEPEKINCTTEAPDIIRQVNNRLYISVNNNQSIKCCYRAFWRRKPKPNEKDNKYVTSEICSELYNNEYNDISDEFIKVECKVNDKKYKYFYSFIQKTKVIDKLNRKKSENDYLSVLVIGLDAVSRLNFHRQMPKTFKYLTDNLGAREMFGYNKIGDNTYPNLMVVLTGTDQDTIDRECLKKSKDRRFDNCPLIWKWFGEKDYVTVYAEDSTDMGLFNYNLKGFFDLTTDFDYRTFDKAAQSEIGHNHKMNSDLCFGNDLRIGKLVNYTKQFAQTFKHHPYFGIFWGVSISHDYLNNVKLADDIYMNFFKELYESKSLTNTAVFVMSDHGIRWGPIRQTYQGFLEERLPFLFIAAPDWFKKKYTAAWANLITNTNRLTTPYDLHQTFIDLRNLNNLKLDVLKDRMKYLASSNTTHHSVSLFLPIPKSRTCDSAKIPSHFCTCQIFTKVNTTDVTVRKVAQVIVDRMNELLTGYRECAKLTLKNIVSANKGLTNMGAKEKLSNIHPEYRLIIITEPGDGEFEATVKETNSRFVITDTISRINLYGSQSRCITDFNLKLYCYCKN